MNTITHQSTRTRRRQRIAQLRCGLKRKLRAAGIIEFDPLLPTHELSALYIALCGQSHPKAPRT